MTGSFVPVAATRLLALESTNNLRTRASSVSDYARALECVPYVGPSERVRNPPLYQISEEELNEYIEDFLFFASPIENILARKPKTRKYLLARYSKSVESIKKNIKLMQEQINELERKIAELKSLEESEQKG